MPRLLFCLVCAVLCFPCRSSAGQRPPATHITNIPFKILTGGVMIVTARFDTCADTLHFVLDTGSGGISLDSSTAARLQVPTELSNLTIRGIAGIHRVRFTYNKTLHLPGLQVDSLDFHINDYDILTASYGQKIDGIIGYSFLSRYIVKVNYDSSRLEVFTPGEITYPKGGFLMKPGLSTIPVMDATLQDDRTTASRFYFDTGAGMCLLLSQAFVADSAFIKTRRKWYATQAEGLGGKKSMKLGVIKRVRIGPYKFRKVPTYIFEDEYNVTAYPNLGGLVGNDLLRRFNLVINYSRREIHLKPNSHFREKFDYSYTGLGLYMVNGEIEVVDVMPGSPAQAAGFEPGDIIMAIENDFSHNIQRYKNLLQTAGARLKIVVFRSHSPLVLVLKVKNIL